MTGLSPLDALVVGRVFYDLVMAGVSPPAPGAEVFARAITVTPGGAATRAVAAARLGMRTGLVAAVGRDRFGDDLVGMLAAEPRLDPTWLQRPEGVHTAVTVAMTDATDRSFVTYEEPGTGVPATVDPPLPGVGVCHIGIADGPAAAPWLAALRAAGTVVVGGVGWDETGRWDPATLERLCDVDAFVPNEEEALRYTRTDGVEAAAERLTALTPVVCITRGAAGAFALDAATGERVQVPAPVTRVVDPTGAGDCFVAAFAAGRVAGWDLRTTVAVAVLAASLSVARLGGAAAAPTRAEVGEAVTAGLRREDLPTADWPAVLRWTTAPDRP